MAPKDLVSANEQTGCLPWMVQRSAGRSSASMVLAQVTWEITVTLSLPLQRKKHSKEWEPNDLPAALCS